MERGGGGCVGIALIATLFAGSFRQLVIYCKFTPFSQSPPLITLLLAQLWVTRVDLIKSTL